jgi:hypothetical protein
MEPLWSPAGATGGNRSHWDAVETGSDRRKPLPCVASACRRGSMVRRGSPVRVRKRAPAKVPQSGTYCFRGTCTIYSVRWGMEPSGCEQVVAASTRRAENFDFASLIVPRPSTSTRAGACICSKRARAAVASAGFLRSQRAGRGRLQLPTDGAPSVGRTMVKTVPAPGEVSSVIAPPWAVTSSATMARPRPVPRRGWLAVGSACQNRSKA